MNLKRTLVGAGVGLVVLVGAASVAPLMIDMSKYNQQILDAAFQATGYDVAVNGSIGVRVVPLPSLFINDVVVRLPGTSGAAPLAAFDRLSVSVSILPLLSGKITVSDVELVKPIIHIARKLDGSFDFMTPKLAKTTGQKADEERGGLPDAQPAPTTSKNMSVEISNITIRDGHIVFDDQQSGQKHDVTDLNTSASLDALTGPFSLMGHGIYNGTKATWRGNIGRTDQEDSRVNVIIGAPDFGTDIKFDGTFSPRAGGTVTGALDIKARAWNGLVEKLTGQNIPAPDAPLSLKTNLSATRQNIVMDKVDFNYSDLVLNGVLKVRMPDATIKKPLVYARLENTSVLDVRKLMTTRAEKDTTSARSSLKKKSATQPTSLHVALPVDLDVELSSPGVQVARIPMRDVSVVLKSENNALHGKIKIGALPGAGILMASVYPDDQNAIMIDVDMTATNVKELLEAGLGVPVPPTAPVDQLRNLHVASELQINPSVITAKTGSVSWSGGDISFGGSAYNTSGTRPLAVLVLGSEKLDINSLMGKGASNSSTKTEAVPEKTSTKDPIKQAVLNSLRNIASPVDLDFSTSFGTLQAGGKVLSNVTAVGKWTENALSLSRFDVGSVDGATVSAHGSVGNIQTLDNVDMNFTVSTQDVKKLAQIYNVSLPSDDISALRLGLVYKGSVNQGDVKLDATISGVTFGAAGPVSDPLGAPQMNNVKLSMTSSQSANLFKLVQPGFNVTQPLQGPLSLSADTTVSDKIYTLKNANGTMGNMTVKGDVTADVMTPRPKISGGLTLGDVPLDALMGVSREGGASKNNGARASLSASSTSKWSTEAINTDWMRAFDLDFMIAAKSITYNMWILSNPSLSLVLNNGALSVKDAKTNLFGGTMTANVNMAATTAGAPITVSAKTNMDNVNARSLTNALMNRAINRLDGTVGFGLDVSTTGTSPAALVGSLNGSGNSGGQKITVNGIDVPKLVSWLTTDLKPSNTIDGLMGSFMGSGATVFDTHTGAYTIKNGQVTFDTFNFDGTTALLSTTGGLNIPAWSVDTKTTLKIKQPANVPELSFTFKGSLNNPVQNMTGNIFENYLKDKLQERAVKLIDKKLGGKLNDLGLGGLLGGGATAPAQPVSPAPDTPVTPEETLTPSIPEQIKPEDVLIDVIKGLGR